MQTTGMLDGIAIRLARLYDARARRPFDSRRYAKTVQGQTNFLERFIPSPISSILDIGCGRGFHLAELVRRGSKELSGIDLSADSVAVARRLLIPLTGGNSVQLTVGDIRTFDPGKRFALLYSFLSTFGAFGPSGDRAFLRRVSLLLESDGRFVLQLFNPFNLHAILGQHDVQYSKSTAIRTTTTVRTTAGQRELLIRQKDILPTGRTRILPLERLRMYDMDELRDLFARTNLDIIKFYGSCDSDTAEIYQHNSEALVVVAARR
jgi:SAM-dependent methyltransferase